MIQIMHVKGHVVGHRVGKQHGGRSAGAGDPQRTNKQPLIDRTVHRLAVIRERKRRVKLETVLGPKAHDRHDRERHAHDERDYE